MIVERSKARLKIATRKSPFALWQAEYVKRSPIKVNPELTLELVPMMTKGAMIKERVLSKMGGKRLFC